MSDTVPALDPRLSACPAVSHGFEAATASSLRPGQPAGHTSVAQVHLSDAVQGGTKNVVEEKDWENVFVFE